MRNSKQNSMFPDGALNDNRTPKVAEYRSPFLCVGREHAELK